MGLLSIPIKYFGMISNNFSSNLLTTRTTYIPLAEFQNHNINTLLPKKDKDTSSINYWKPTSLLKVHYIIASKTIALK